MSTVRKNHKINFQATYEKSLITQHDCGHETNGKPLHEFGHMLTWINILARPVDDDSPLHTPLCHEESLHPTIKQVIHHINEEVQETLYGYKISKHRHPPHHVLP